MAYILKYLILKKTVSRYRTLFVRYPEMGLFVFYLPKKDGTLKECITRNDTNVDKRILYDEDLMQTLAREMYLDKRNNSCPEHLLQTAIDLMITDEKDGTPCIVSQYLTELKINPFELRKVIKTLPKEWNRASVKVGNSIRGRIGFGQGAIVPTVASIDDYTPTKLEREAAGW